MPWLSKAQSRWGHSTTGLAALGGKKAVHEWDAATRKGSLPDRVRHPGIVKRAEQRRGKNDKV